jgi:hypothetical protein
MKNDTDGLRRDSPVDLLNDEMARRRRGGFGVDVPDGVGEPPAAASTLVGERGRGVVVVGPAVAA